jgi:hypothetical protein
MATKKITLTELRSLVKNIVKEEQSKKKRVIKEESENIELKFKKGYGYWDVTKYPYGGDFKRFTGDEIGILIKGNVKKGDEINVKLNNGREIVATANSVSNFDFDEVLNNAKTIGRKIIK